ncbi:protein gvpL [Halobellus salinus]|uniref:Protein gvpL n=1 Tax=Halobellus salinus TaxID=931585 RepID=A0A830E9W5_9EURY|nr:GvpL/GvpF family gas vesicle protein [Halobellus salinus]GGJ05366.1 protein gvpL [Halobellus salinus]SMP23235.1 Gas vesicle synthesis protein GvpL/GvpF [Halobellus salinus]
MTDRSRSLDDAQTTAADDEQSVRQGRYLYCAVDTTTSDTETLPTAGIDGNRVYLIESDEIGAVVHDCDTVYTADDLERIKQWVVTHQQVVDAAGDVFGTPLPMRFDTVLEGGDESVKHWLADQYESIHRDVQSFAGMWEYRITLEWDPSPFEDRITERDDRLQELQQRQQQSGAGKQFLLEKQYDKHVRELKHDQRTELAAQLKETITPVVNSLVEQDSRPTLSGDADTSTEQEQVLQVAVLADEDAEKLLGERLDTIVEQNGVEIRFTGPWPPYTFAPDIGSE